MGLLSALLGLDKQEEKKDTGLFGSFLNNNNNNSNATSWGLSNKEKKNVNSGDYTPINFDDDQSDEDDYYHDDDK